MDKEYYDRKQERILSLYSKFLSGEIINKKTEAERFRVSSRTLQRDIEDLRIFLANQVTKTGVTQLIVYDKKLGGYQFWDDGNCRMTNSEVLAVCKILLESRAFVKAELFPIIKKILENCSPQGSKQIISELIGNEQYHYVEPHHQTKFINQLWEIGVAIKEHKYLQIKYTKLKNKATVDRLVKPVGIMFSEFYFYMVAFIDGIDKEKEFEYKDDLFPTIYRVDRIKQYIVTTQNFSIPYKDRFEEGEFRKRIQFMYGGKLQKITFEYAGISIESVLDRLPTAIMINESSGIYTITAEVFGKGIEKWIRSQGDDIKILEWG